MSDCISLDISGPPKLPTIWGCSYWEKRLRLGAFGATLRIPFTKALVRGTRCMAFGILNTFSIRPANARRKKYVARLALCTGNKTCDESQAGCSKMQTIHLVHPCDICQSHMSCGTRHTCMSRSSSRTRACMQQGWAPAKMLC